MLFDHKRVLQHEYPLVRIFKRGQHQLFKYAISATMRSILKTWGRGEEHLKSAL